MTSEVHYEFHYVPIRLHDITIGCGITLFLDQDTLAGPSEDYYRTVSQTGKDWRLEWMERGMLGPQLRGKTCGLG